MNFRGLTPAAPLKLEVSPEVAGVGTDFRGLTPAAPLKPCGLRGRERRMAGFPRANTRGPIEARPRQYVFSDLWISAG